MRIRKTTFGGLFAPRTAQKAGWLKTFWFPQMRLSLKQLFKKNNNKEKAPQPPAVLDDALKFEARELLAQGRKIQAVKLVREQTGWGLKQAKDFVDSLT